MSGLMNKVKAAMSGEKETHEAGVASNVNDDYDTGAGTGLGSSGTTGYNNSTTGNTGHHGAHNAGPHTSKLANEADPRVDSDLSGGRGNTGGLTGTTSQGYGSNTSGGLGREYDNTSGSTGQGFGSNTTGGVGQGADSTTGITGHHGSHNAGPHASKLANKADPRVDSDLSGNRGTTGGLTGSTGQGYGSTTTGGVGDNYGSTAGSTGQSYGSSGTTGTGLGGAGYDGTTTGNAGLTGHGEHHGHHRQGEDIVHGGAHYTETANKLDPHVSTSSSGLGTSSMGNTGRGSGAAVGSTGDQSTTGPHKSSMLNKLDPRVDTSGRGASNTAGEYDGNSTARGGATTGGYDDNLSKSTSNFSGTTLGESGATHGSNTTGGYGTTGNNSGNNQDLGYSRSVTASNSTPSKFAEHHGEPEIVHGDHSHKRTERHESLQFDKQPHVRYGPA